MKKIIISFLISASIFITGCQKPPSPEDATFKLETATTAGSAVYIGNGLLLTAAHVVKDGKEFDAKNYLGWSGKAKVLWVSEDYDIAMVRIEDAGQPSANIDCSPLHISDSIESVGAPLAIDNVRIWGKVSSSTRDFGPWKEVNFVSMTIIPGMSGGPIFNESGDLVGINVGTLVAPLSGLPSLAGVGMVVPMNTVCQMIGKD